MGHLGEPKSNGKYLQEEPTSGYTVKGMHMSEGAGQGLLGALASM